MNSYAGASRCAAGPLSKEQLIDHPRAGPLLRLAQVTGQKHTPVPPERREEQQLDKHGGVFRPAPFPGADLLRHPKAGLPEPQAVANFRSLIAAKSLTSPPMRLVA